MKKLINRIKRTIQRRCIENINAEVAKLLKEIRDES